MLWKQWVLWTEAFLEGQIKSLNLIVFSCSLLYMFRWLHVAIAFYSPNSRTWENLNVSVKIVILYYTFFFPHSFLVQGTVAWLIQKKKDHSLSSNYIISLLLQQNCLPHSILLWYSISLQWFTVKVTGSFLGDQQLETEHFPQIYIQSETNKALQYFYLSLARVMVGSFHS